MRNQCRDLTANSMVLGEVKEEVVASFNPWYGGRRRFGGRWRNSEGWESGINLTCGYMNCKGIQGSSTQAFSRPLVPYNTVSPGLVTWSIMAVTSYHSLSRYCSPVEKLEAFSTDPGTKPVPWTETDAQDWNQSSGTGLIDRFIEAGWGQTCSVATIG